MKQITSICIATLLLLTVTRAGFGETDIENVSPQRAKQLGINIQAKALGGDDVRIEFQFPLRKELKDFNRVELQLREKGKLLMRCDLHEQRPQPATVRVSSRPAARRSIRSRFASSRPKAIWAAVDSTFGRRISWI